MHSSKVCTICVAALSILAPAALRWQMQRAQRTPMHGHADPGGHGQSRYCLAHCAGTQKQHKRCTTILHVTLTLPAPPRGLAHGAATNRVPGGKSFE